MQTSSPDLRPVRTDPDPLLARSRWQSLRAAAPGGPRWEGFPLGQHLRAYTWSKARQDLRAATNVALLDFPQGMAYAVIAGLPFYRGIFASITASVSGPLLASSRHLMLGPTNAIAVLCLSGTLTLGLDPAETVAIMPLLLLLVGLFLIAGALLRVAVVVNYVSRPVLTGYITGGALLIIAKQLRHVLGVHPPATASFLDSFWEVLQRLEQTHLPSLALGLLAAAVYFAIKRGWPRLPDVAVTLVLMFGAGRAWAALGYPVQPLSETSFGLTGWPISLPELSWGRLADLGELALAIAFLSLLESASIAKTLAARSGDSVNINQQMLSMGVANLAGAFSSGMPVSGSLTRSEVNWRSGAQTPLASVYSGCLLLVGLLVLGPFMSGIPMPALAMLVILVGISLINPQNIRFCLSATAPDASAFLVTLITALFLPLTTAIFVGVGLSLALFLRQVAIPSLQEIVFDESGAPRDNAPDRPVISLLHVEGDLFFGSSEVFLNQTRRLAANANRKILILRLRNARHIDATCVQTILELSRFLREQGGYLLLSGVQPEVETVFRNSGLLQAIGPENVFLEDPANPTRSTALALRRAKALFGEAAGLHLWVGDKRKESPTSPAP